MDLTLLGEKIKKLRKSQNMTQNDLSAVLGYSESYISYIEKGQRQLSVSDLNKLANFFSVNMDYFVPKAKTAHSHANTDKRLEEFDIREVLPFTLDYARKHPHEMESTIADRINVEVNYAITQAIAEDREWLVERLEDIKEKNPGSIYGFESISNGGIDYAIEEIKRLSSLDKTLANPTL